MVHNEKTLKGIATGFKLFFSLLLFMSGDVIFFDFLAMAFFMAEI